MRYFIYFILSLTSYISQAEIYQNNIPDDLQEFVNSIPELTKNVQGGSIAILHKGEVIYKNSFGFGKETLEAINNKTLFPLASVSKAVSSAAVALMTDKGMLNLDKGYKIPYLKSEVTIKNILGSTTGYRYSGNQEIEAGLTRKKLLAKLGALPQSCEAGKCYFYSNICFSLISDVLEKEKYSLNYAINNLTKTLNTDEIKLYPLDPNLKIAYPHNKKHMLLPNTNYYQKTVPAAAGIYASIDGMIELYKFLFWYRQDLISNETLEKFYKPYIKADIKHWNLPYEEEIDSYYGLGWRIFTPKKDRQKNIIFHSGRLSGVNSFIGFMPHNEMGIIVITNQEPPHAVRIGLGLWREFWD